MTIRHNLRSVVSGHQDSDLGGDDEMDVERLQIEWEYHVSEWMRCSTIGSVSKNEAWFFRSL
jgi:hypothetical protein